MEKYKTCPKCKQTKSLSEWGKNKSKKDGLASECKQCHARASFEWRQKYPEEQKKRSKTQYAKSRDREIKRRKERYLANRPEELIKRKENYAQNAEKYREQSRQWRANNKEAYAAQSRKSRAIRAAVRTQPYSVADVLAAYGDICHICGQQIDLNAPRWTGSEGWQRGLHLDHVIRIADGGEDSLENVRPTHGLCNLKKH